LCFVSSKSRITISSVIGAILASIFVLVIPTNSVQAETGKGKDIFKVIMTIFGVDESKGDVVAIVTAKDEQAKVKLFDASGPAVVPLNASEGGGHLIEYVATFPNLTVNSGDEYKACVATVKDLELICKSGNNSPAARPEFVDLSLNASSSASQVTIEESDVEDEATGEDEDEGEEDSNISPGITPT
jgi:hypothetical protein